MLHGHSLAVAEIQPAELRLVIQEFEDIPIPRNALVLIRGDG